MDVAARLPVAPPLLIGAIGVLSTFDISSAKILPVTSAKPPAGKATTISIGLEGYFSCDHDWVGAAKKTIPASKASTDRILLLGRIICFSFSNLTQTHLILICIVFFSRTDKPSHFSLAGRLGRNPTTPQNDIATQAPEGEGRSAGIRSRRALWEA